MTLKQWIRTSSNISNRAYTQRHFECIQNVTIQNESLAFKHNPTVDYAVDVSVDFKLMRTACRHCNALQFWHEPPEIYCVSRMF